MKWFLAIIAVIGLGISMQDAGAQSGSKEVNVVRIAGSAPNRIVTPYKDPKIVTNFPHEAWSVGNVLYLLPSEEEGMIGGFVQDSSGEFAVSIMFEIARIPPQEVRLDDPAFEPVEPVGSEDLQSGKAESHVDDVVSILVSALDQDRIPGFRQIQANSQEVYVGPFLKRLVSSQRRGSRQVDRYRIAHEGLERRALNEASFSAPGRLGVLIFPPRSHLDPGEEVSVFVLREVGHE